MPIPASYVGSLTTHAFFVAEGLAFTLPAPGTVGRDAKPGAGDTLWQTYNLGDLEEFKRQPTSNTEDVWGGSPGGRIKKDVVEISRELKITFKTTQWDPIAVRFGLSTLPLTTASSQANPLEGKAVERGWLKLQIYDINHVLRETTDVWVAMRATDMDPLSGSNLVKVTFEADVLYSAYNTSSFA